ncbi:PQQ-dependent sugar dehydrogenase [Alkalicoccobacillus gibsonii]|uniref:PQQ-dependent sugar dehydrogenase n=1 Tax=Alkalicoccobacillus gibsonii TaxID=79881 RepID=UPI0019316793|nr:PQQ-dependent sugar dehydrogenase [Alkalicoccobacillus gibsonii]MBM0064991.1 PQQ-dependent sugar dehydrogenase [Alkalicoccobacillus gibsonii]
MKKTLMIGFAASVLTACGVESVDEESSESNGQNQRDTNDTDDIETGENVIADSLNSPWAMQMHQDEWFITDRDGNLLMVQDGEVIDQTLNLSEEIVQQGESGLLGFVLHPDFESNQQAFLYHSYQDSEGIKNRVIQVVRNEDVWEEEAELLGNIPGAPTHNGGRLAVFEDELYVTTGDAEDPSLSQDVDSLAGKILKMTFDGSIPSAMPMEDSYVWSYGHRNPQGLAWLEDGTMYSSEHGQTALDEVNQIEPGNNYGWPDYEGDETSDDTKAPFIHSGDDTWAPSGLVATGDQLYMAGLRGEAVYEVNVDGGEISSFIEGYGRIRDVLVQDNQLYFLTNNTDGRGNPDDTDDKLIEVELN